MRQAEAEAEEERKRKAAAVRGSLKVTPPARKRTHFCWVLLYSLCGDLVRMHRSKNALLAYICDVATSGAATHMIN